MDINAEIQILLDELTGCGYEQALQFAAVLDGELIVDAVSGLADPDKNIPATQDSLFPVYSCSKGVAATAVLRGVEKGILELNRPLAEYWPGFGVNGKEKITLVHVLSHTAGLAPMPEVRSYSEIIDWNYMCKLMANATPLHPPGMERYYQAITYSWAVCNPLVIADGRDFNSIIQEDIFSGLGEEFYFGVPPDKLDRIGRMEEDPNPLTPLEEAEPTPAEAERLRIAKLSIPAIMTPLSSSIEMPEIRQGCIPGCNGIGTARALARYYSGVIAGKFLGNEMLDEATKLIYQTGDIAGLNRVHALGYMIDVTQNPDTPARTFGHDGHGGSNAVADRKYHLAAALTKNRIVNDWSGERYSAKRVFNKLYDLLGFERISFFS